MRNTFLRLLSFVVCAVLLVATLPTFAAAAPSPEPTEAVPFYLVGSTFVYIAYSGEKYHSTSGCYPIERPYLLSLKKLAGWDIPPVAKTAVTLPRLCP